MKKSILLLPIVLIFSSISWKSNPIDDDEKYWPQWRGPLATGESPLGNPPLQWSEEKNIKWKIPIAGLGISSPIVWKDLVFITTAINTKNSEGQASGGRRRGIRPDQVLKFSILAINRSDGKIAWEKTAIEEFPHEGTHATGTWASNSAITDGENLYVYFGSRGLYCYDMQGNLKWKKDLGDMNKRRAFGEGSSPALYGNKIIINWDHEGKSFITALDKNNGDEIWKVNRDEITSWTTPLAVEHNGKGQVITSATGKVRSYDISNGELIWQSSGMTLNAIPSPVAADGMVYVTSGFRGSAFQAIRLDDAKGNIKGSEAIVWQYDQDTPYVPSPLLYKNTIYILKGNTGVLTSLNAKTGEPYYSRQRLDGIRNVYASPVAAIDRVYITSRDGKTLVIKHGATFEVLASNSLDDDVDASMAIVDNEIYLRGRKYLYCIAEK